MVNATHFKCACQHCHGHLECPVEASGQSAECPHCGKTTDLVIPAPPAQNNAPARKIIFLTSFGLILAILIGFVVIKLVERHELVRQQAAETARLAAEQAAEAEAKADDPLAQAGWTVANIRIEKTPGSQIIHAVGTLQNKTDRRRFGVKIQLDLFDAADQKIGGATDYQPTIEAQGRWQFSALVVNAKAVTAKVAAVAESP